MDIFIQQDGRIQTNITVSPDDYPYFDLMELHYPRQYEFRPGDQIRYIEPPASPFPQDWNRGEDYCVGRDPMTNNKEKKFNG